MGIVQTAGIIAGTKLKNRIVEFTKDLQMLNIEKMKAEFFALV